MEVLTVIWIGIAAIIVIALVIAAIGRPPDGPGGTRRPAGYRPPTPSGTGRPAVEAVAQPARTIAVRASACSTSVTRVSRLERGSRASIHTSGQSEGSASASRTVSAS